MTRLPPQQPKRETMTSAERYEHFHALHKLGIRKRLRIRKVEPITAESILREAGPNDWMSEVCTRWFRA